MEIHKLLCDACGTTVDMIQNNSGRYLPPAVWHYFDGDHFCPDCWHDIKEYIRSKKNTETNNG